MEPQDRAFPGKLRFRLTMDARVKPEHDDQVRMQAPGAPLTLFAAPARGNRLAGENPLNSDPVIFPGKGEPVCRSVRGWVTGIL